MRRTWVPALIFLLTVAVRGFLVSRLPEKDFLYGEVSPQGLKSLDEGINVAVSLSRSGEFANPFCEPTGPSAHVPPAYPFVTAAIFRLFGYGRAAATVRNGIDIAGFGLLYASFPAAAAALGLGAPAGIFAGFGAALFPTFRSAEIFLGRDEWAAALVLLWLTIYAYRICIKERFRVVDAIIFGAGWALLLHIQPSAVSVLPFHVLICTMGSRVRANAKPMIVSLTLAVVLLIPWTLRNHRELGGWFFIRDNLGLELHMAYGDGAQPSQAQNQATGRYDEIHPIRSTSVASEIAEMGELRFNQRLFQDAIAWIPTHPTQVAALTRARVAAFWADLPVIHARAPRLFWSVLGWLGLFLMWRARLRSQILVLAPVLGVYPLIYYFLQFSNRYVVPVSFAIFLPAGFAAVQIYTALRQRVRQQAS